MGYQLGIDLGTTYTAAAVCRSSDRRWVEPEVITLGTRSATVPSVLFLPPDGSVVVGEAAERRALTDPDRVVREFKRRIGDPTPVMVAGRAWAPEELSAQLVRWVVDRVAEREGGPATRIAVTHPASWGAHKKDLLGAALAAQGLSVVFLAEPQAAALHYAAAERVEPGSTIAVYDLGGGTFDAAVVRKAQPGNAASGAAGFGLLGRPEGLERLGGIDFDEVVFEHVRNGLPDSFEGLDDTDPAVLSAVARVRRECTEAKEALSSDTEVAIPVLMPGSRGSVRLHRTEFESLIRPQVEETVAALRTAVASAGLTPEQLTAVLLVGGSSRIPLVAQLVSEQLGRPVAVDADPKNAIAKGAALAVSPKPTASWPGVAIPPVGGVPAGVAAAGYGAAAGAVGVGAAAARGASAPVGFAPSGPPPRPPRPTFTPPQGVPEPLGAAAGAGAPRARGPVGPTHEPATSLLAGNGSPQPPPRPPARRDPEPEQDWDYDAETEPRRRPVGLLVAAGALVAIGLVVVVVLAMSQGTGGPRNGDIGPGAVPSVTLPSDVADPADPVDTDQGTDETPNTGGGSGSGTGGGAGVTGERPPPNDHTPPGGGTTPVNPPADTPVETPVETPVDTPEPPVDTPEPPVDTPVTSVPVTPPATGGTQGEGPDTGAEGDPPVIDDPVGDPINDPVADGPEGLPDTTTTPVVPDPTAGV